MIQKGLLLAKQQGDLDALQFAFSVTIREHLPPGVNPNYLEGIYEAAHEPFPFEVLKELKQAVQNCGTNSPFTMGLIQGVAESN